MSDQTTELIGKILDASAQRDAVHIALAPLVAAERLGPGYHIRLNEDGKAICRRDGAIGIVDPFLEQFVEVEQRFFAFLYPRTVTSLRHEWTHPAFARAESTTGPARDKSLEQHDSEQWLRHFAEEVGVSYGALMNAIRNKIADESEYFCLNYDTPDICYDQREEMWKHYEIVTGEKVADHDASVFTCSC